MQRPNALQSASSIHANTRAVMATDMSRCKFTNRKSGGFTLIELMIVVAIIGILGSLAVSTYQTYVVRTQVAEGLNLAGAVKIPVVEAYLQDGIAPANRAAAGMSANTADNAGGYVTGIDVINGRIEIAYGASAHAAITGQTLSLSPYIGVGGNSVVWRCGSAGAPAGAQINGADPHPAPTVAARYLPPICRP